ncbi:MAG: Uma2 family endonuclease [Desulfobacteraceae bacterium]|nr:Uma2 family endonuclease [Desulfobacteraceae bacterium]
MTTAGILKSDDIYPSVTGHELFEMGDIGRTELVTGELISMSPTGYTHGIIENHFGRILGNFVRQYKLGEVLVGEVGIYTSRNPDTVRGADVIYISNETLAKTKSQSYLDVAPELIIEILSPGDRWNDVTDKLDEYFSIGVQEVWVADPRRRQVFVYLSLTGAVFFGRRHKLC